MFVEDTIKKEKENENRIPDSNCKSVELYSYTTFTQSLDSQTDRIIEKENDVRDSSTSLERQQLTLPLKDTVQAHFTIIQSMYPFEGFTY